MYSHTPKAINSCYIQNSLGYRPSNKTILETLSFAYGVVLETLKTQSRINDNHPYFNYAEK